MPAVRIEHALRVLGRAANRAAEEALEPLNITPIEYDILETIKRFMDNPEEYTLKVPNISTLIGIHRASGFDRVPRLERSGYVRHAPGGSRLLTTRGLQKLEECRRALKPTERLFESLFANKTAIEAFAEAFLTQQEGVHDKWR